MQHAFAKNGHSKEKGARKDEKSNSFQWQKGNKSIQISNNRKKNNEIMRILSDKI